MNIRFEYLYRDAGNFKRWGDVVFSNTKDNTPEKLEQRAREVLIDHEFFVAESAGVPSMKFDEHIDALDHDWHCFSRFVPTIETPNDKAGRDVEDFIEMLKEALATC